MYLPHTGHVKTSYQTWAKQQMPLSSQQYLQKLVESGATPAQFKVTIRKSGLSNFNSEDLKDCAPALVPEAFLIKSEDFHSCKRNHKKK